MAHKVAVRPTATSFATPTTSQPQSILSRKRANRDHDDDEESSQAPAKRLKVTFDTDVDIKKLDKPGEKDIAVIKEEVRKAILQKSTGESEAYEEIKHLFDEKPDSEDAPSTTLLRKYLYALIHNANSLTGRFSDLVNTVLTTQWLAHDEPFASAYIRFLGQLGSSHTAYIPAIMRTLVANFAHLSMSAGVIARTTRVIRQKLIARVHLALKYILQLIPTSSGALLSVLPKEYPYIDDTRKSHVEYAKNLLKVIDYAPELKSDILDLITARLIKIDVEVQMDLEELEEDADELLVDDKKRTLGDEDEIELSDNESDEEDDDDFDTAAELNAQRIKTTKASVEKMDILMDLLFDYHSSKSINPDQASLTMNLLLSQFSKTVLPTYRSRHTQFLLFHFAQKSPEATEVFLQQLLSILTSKQNTSILRMSAAAYLGSFIARGAHISSDDVFATFQALSDFIHTCRMDYEPRCAGPNLKAFGPYYAAFQALTYIFCFRWRDLLADPEDFDEEDLLNGSVDLQWAQGVRDTFSVNTISPLNPLKVCSQQIVDEFARIAKYLNLVYVYHILDGNKRIRLSQFVKTLAVMGRETALSGLDKERGAQLESYFPFDPYRLPISRKWVESDFNEWKGVHGLHTLDVEDAGEERSDDDTAVSDEEDSSDEDEDDEDEINTEGTETPRGSLL
jgi:RNA polymerase I-specific transcription initiation factor RRN3